MAAPNLAASSIVAAKVVAVTGPTPGTVQNRLTTSSSLTIFSSTTSASAICRLSNLKLSKSGAIAVITCVGKLAASTRAIKLFEPPEAMRHPSLRASAPISEMYFERVRTSVDLTRSCALIFLCFSEVRCACRSAPRRQASHSVRASRLSVLIFLSRVAYMGAKLGSARMTSCPNASR